MHICVNDLTAIDSDNGLLSGWRQVIIWTSAGILLIQLIVTNFSEIIEIVTFVICNNCRLWNGGHFASILMCLLICSDLN